MNIITSPNPSSLDFFCFNDNAMCRLTHYYDIPNVIWLSTLTVDYLYRNKGLGTQLLIDIENFVKQEGWTIISLQTKRKSWLEKWYKKKGFITVADGYDEGMVIMSKILNISKLVD